MMKHQRVKFSPLEEQELLIGNSGCKLSIFKDKIYKVRKKSTNKINSKRLYNQYIKTKDFKNFYNISVPKIYLISGNKKNFYFDMEYINGSTLSLYMMSQPISSTYKIIDDLIKFILNCKKKNYSKNKNIIFQNKIKNLQKKKIFKDKFFLKIFKFLRDYNWCNIEKTPSHGDLSLENIIIKKKLIKFIDISANFIESYKLDISKIIFDLICLWSFRNVNLKIDQLKIYSLKRYLIEQLSKKLSKDDFIDIKMLIVLDFIRVLDYTKNKEDRNLLKKKLKHFYENINTTLRW